MGFTYQNNFQQQITQQKQMLLAKSLFPSEMFNIFKDCILDIQPSNRFTKLFQTHRKHLFYDTNWGFIAIAFFFFF